MEAFRERRGERRTPAPHPGPDLFERYIVPLGIDPDHFARLVGMDPDRLRAMFAGSKAIDVDAAVRLGRSLGVPPQRVIGAQLRHDFAVSRSHESTMPRPPADTLVTVPLPPGARAGTLARVPGVESEQLLFLEAADAAKAPGMDRVHKLAAGDRLRIYDAAGRCVWSGPLLADLDGSALFVFARRSDWEPWFDDGLRADWVPARKP